MFDNLRDSSFYEEEQTEIEQPQQAKSVAPRRRRKTRSLGLTGQQRFFLSVMFMFTVVVMGLLAMFVLGKMALF
jgi:hypothetical protein